MSNIRYPEPTWKTAERRRSLAPEAGDGFRTSSPAIFAESALDPRAKQLIAVAEAHARNASGASGAM